MQSTIEDLSAKLVSGIAALNTSHEYGEFTRVADARLERCKLAFASAPPPKGTLVNDDSIELSKYQQFTLMIHNLVTNLVTEVKQQVKLEMRMEMLREHAVEVVPASDDVVEDTEANILDFIDALQVQSLSNLDTQ